MAKGIPLMGRGPDGKAKMINVDEHGNVKVQLSGNLVAVSVEETATAVVGQSAFAVKQVVAIYNDSDTESLYVSFNNSVWHRIPPNSTAFQNALIQATTLYYYAASAAAFRAWGVA